MVQRGKGGAIIRIASTAAFVGLPGRGPYCAAKAGIMGLTRALALEVATANIRVNAVAPGFTRTKLIEQGIENGSLQEEWMVERVPMDRLAAPEEIAGIACFLASDAAAYMTGQVIIADGGWTVQGQGARAGLADHRPERRIAPSPKSACCESREGRACSGGVISVRKNPCRQSVAA